VWLGKSNTRNDEILVGRRHERAVIQLRPLESGSWNVVVLQWALELVRGGHTTLDRRSKWLNCRQHVYTANVWCDERCSNYYSVSAWIPRMTGMFGSC